MSASEENEPTVLQANQQEDEISISSLQTKLEALEYNVNCIVKVGLKRDEILAKTSAEVVRLKKTVKILLLGSNTGKESLEESNDGELFNRLQVYVGNIDPRATDQYLKDYFKTFGTVVDAWFLKKHVSSQCGLVEFSTKEMADAVLAARPHIVHGRRLIVLKSINKNFPKRVFGKPPSSTSPKATTSTRNNRYSPY